jgi:hypothetical protein
MKAPTSNFQAPEKLQAPSFKYDADSCLKFDAWCFSGCWSLVLGAFPTLGIFPE